MNKALAILFLYPNANPLVDFEVLDEGDGPQLVRWEVKDENGDIVPEPTDAELFAAWEAYQANPPEPPETDAQKIARLEQEIAVEREDKLMVMEALTEVYEKVLILEAQVAGGTPA
ncbi:XkdW family protein [Paenibacillus thermotolerans]|uniref:XkdW family protein n=1 Tax=Paenibacillus thermotolerans TaxID=3027807 RepID=UPI002367C70D|nr:MULTISPECIES: XkdW family protein [unclassified Paenibacillus]